MINSLTNGLYKHTCRISEILFHYPHTNELLSLVLTVFIADWYGKIINHIVSSLVMEISDNGHIPIGNVLVLK